MSKPSAKAYRSCELIMGRATLVYFGQVGATLVILLCAGSKRTQTADIKRAKKYWADYRRRAKESETKR